MRTLPLIGALALFGLSVQPHRLRCAVLPASKPKHPHKAA